MFDIPMSSMILKDHRTCLGDPHQPKLGDTHLVRTNRQFDIAPLSSSFLRNYNRHWGISPNHNLRDIQYHQRIIKRFTNTLGGSSSGLGDPHLVCIVCAPNMYDSYVTWRLHSVFSFEIVVSIRGSPNTFRVISQYHQWY